MATGLNDIIEATSTAISEFEDVLPFVEKQLAEKVTKIISQLDTVRGQIKPTVKNLRLLKTLRKEIQEVLNDSKYNLAFEKLSDNLGVIDKVNEKYFSTLVGEFTAPKVLAEAQNIAFEEMTQALKGNGINANIVDNMIGMIQKDITGGANFYELNQSLREFILSTPEIPSRLTSYTKQVVTDSVHQYNALYHEILSDDLGLEWYEYNGALVGDSREWCVEMVKKRFIHRSEFPELIKGHINGRQLPIYKKTGLPNGMKLGTNPDNLIVNRGGWSCHHQMCVISEERVPKEIREKIKK